MTTATDQEELDQIINAEKPFGPSTSEEIGDRLFQALFDNSNSIFRKLKRRPSLIIGRRGSGKTSLLSGLRYDSNYLAVIPIPPEDSFAEVISLLDSKLGKDALVETVARIWERSFYSAIFLELAKNYKSKHPKECAILEKYLEKTGVKSGLTITGIIKLAANVISRGQLEGTDKIVEQADKLITEGINFETAKSSFLEIAQARGKKRVLVLIDNLENLDLSSEAHSLAISGLLKGITYFFPPDIPIDIKCCIPSEIYPKLTRISSNVEKDFASSVLLQWNAKELLHLAAIRYKVFLNLNAPPDLRKKFNELDLSKHTDLTKFFRLILPSKILNGKNVPEYPIRYILRHTQLLPRQFIGYMNSICNKSRQTTDQEFMVSEGAVVKGVREYETKVIASVFSGFKSVYPSCESVCENFLPNLNSEFRIGNIHQLFNQKKKDVSEFEDYRSVLKMLVAVGVVGVVEKEENGYTVGQFAYNLPADLSFSDDDIFCVHPIFQERFAVKQLENYRPIFPIGSELVEEP